MAFCKLALIVACTNIHGEQLETLEIEYLHVRKQGLLHSLLIPIFSQLTQVSSFDQRGGSALGLNLTVSLSLDDQCFYLKYEVNEML